MTQERRLNRADVAAAVLAMALAIFVLAQPFVSRTPRLSPGDPGPWLMPSIYGVALLILGGALAWKAFRPKPVSRETLDAVAEFKATEEPAGEDPAAQERRMMPRLLAVALLCVLYTWSFAHLGFYVATGAFLILTMLVLTPRNPRAAVTIVVISVLTTAGVGLVLTRFLEVTLPHGILF